jgi:hypothetical protein
MVQAYAALALPLAAFVQYSQKSILKYPLLAIALLFTIYNFWLTHQAHRGGLIEAGNMTKAYFWKILGKSKETAGEDVRKFLDTDEEFTGVRKNVVLLYKNDFENDTTNTCTDGIAGKRSLCLNKERQFSPEFSAAISNNDADYVRAKATFRATNKEWDVWRMCQFVVKFKNNDQEVKQKQIRVFRLLNDGQTRDLYLDVKLPEESFNKVSVSFWNADSDKQILIDDLVIEKYTE